MAKFVKSFLQKQIIVFFTIVLNISCLAFSSKDNCSLTAESDLLDLSSESYVSSHSSDILTKSEENQDSNSFQDDLSVSGGNISPENIDNSGSTQPNHSISDTNSNSNYEDCSDDIANRDDTSDFTDSYDSSNETTDSNDNSYNPLTEDNYNNQDSNLPLAHEADESSFESDGLISSEVLLNKQTLSQALQPEFDILSDLLSSDIPVGTIVITKGYASVGDGGASSFQITTTSQPNNLFAFRMQNGLYAELILSSTINVAQLGIMPDSYISDSLNNLINASYQNGIINTIEFNDGNYILDKPVALRSLKYKGTGNTILSVSTSFQTNDDKIIYCKPDSISQSYVVDFSGITFLMETCLNHSLGSKQVILLSLQEIDKCKIDNCHFISSPSITNGSFIETNLLWFKHSSKVNNIEITNCSFRNLTGQAYTGAITDYLVGGCLWFCGVSNPLNSTMEHITIKHCDFETTVSDEILALWRGTYNNVEVSDCTFKNSSHDNNNIIAFFNGAFNNTAIKNCTISLYSASKYVIKTTSLAGATKIIYDHVIFEFMSGIADSKSRNIAIFYSGSDSNEVEGVIPAIINIQNCSVYNSSGTVYRSFVALSNTSLKSYDVTNCSLETPFNYGIFSLSKGNTDTINFSSNTFNTYNILSSIENATSCRINIQSNTIKNKLNTVISPSAKFYFNFSNNTCTSANYGSLLTCQNLSSSDYIVYNNSGNNYTSGGTPNTFYSNNNLNYSNVIIPSHTPDGSELEEIAKNTPDHIIDEETDKPSKGSENAISNADAESLFSVIIDEVTYSIDSNNNATIQKIGDKKKIVIDSVTIDGVTYPITSIAPKACKGNKTLKSLTIYKSVVTIGKQAFKGCSNLKKVTIKTNNSLKIGSGAFKGLADGSTIKVKGVSGKAKQKIIKSIKKQTNSIVK